MNFPVDRRTNPAGERVIGGDSRTTRNSLTRESNRTQKRKAATLVMRQQTTPAREPFHVATRTVAALDAITAFAVPTPTTSRKVGQLLGCPTSRPAGANHPVYFGLAKVLGLPTLSTVDGRHTIRGALNVKTQDRCKCQIFPGPAKMSVSVMKCVG